MIKLVSKDTTTEHMWRKGVLGQLSPNIVANSIVRVPTVTRKVSSGPTTTEAPQDGPGQTHWRSPNIFLPLDGSLTAIGWRSLQNEVTELSNDGWATTRPHVGS